MSLTNLPTLDFSSDETLVNSANTRAAVALQASDAPLYYKGLKLRLTVSIKSLFFMLQRLDGVNETAGDRHERDSIILLYLCSQPAYKWSDPVSLNGKLYQPLRGRPGDWLAVIDAWADETLECDDLTGLVEVIDHLWDINHATRPAIDSDDLAGEDQKKTLNQAGKSD